MTIDINAVKSERTCNSCKWHSKQNCTNPDYEKFIEKACKTGWCDGFARKDDKNER